ncbi:MAG: phosphoglycerate kinase [Deltaproteobacteria bacterium]|nr:phosphoglycerate kinase [Deltaproteobacteria bacterium]
MKKLEDLDLTDKLVLIRADLNVPLDRERKITETHRIERFLPTLRYILQNGGRAVVMSHLGRPLGRYDPACSLAPIAQKLGELLQSEVKLAPDCIGPETEAIARQLGRGQTLLLENLRFHAGERTNDPAFASRLAKLGQVYVNDAFATAHRAHASVVGVARHFQHKAPGLLMQKELEFHARFLVQPKRPLCVILGGIKTAGQLHALLKISEQADKVIMGGSIANTFLAAQGVQMGHSVYEPELFSKVLELLGHLMRRGCKTYLPVDFRIGNSPKSKGIARDVTAQELPPETMALDIGPATSILYDEAVKSAETIIWNGPMGIMDNDDYAQGTTDLIQSLAGAHGTTAAGGVDTVRAIRGMELQHRFDHISTGGTSLLSLLEGKQLPGFQALEKE